MNPRHPLLMAGWFLLSAVAQGAAGFSSAPDLAPLKRMIDQAGEIRSLSADITETRNLRTLSRPLVNKGRLWFVAPGSFRWELGQPGASVLIGNANGLFLIRRADGKTSCRRLDSGMSAPMTPLGIPGLFPGDYDAFLRAFRVESVSLSGDRCHTEVTPLGNGALRGVSSLHLDFDTQTGRWTSLRIITRDGSSLCQEFSNVRINTRVSDELFDPGRETAPSTR